MFDWLDAGAHLGQHPGGGAAPSLVFERWRAPVDSEVVSVYGQTELGTADSDSGCQAQAPDPPINEV